MTYEERGIFYAANSESADQTSQNDRLICTFVCNGKLIFWQGGLKYVNLSDSDASVPDKH